MATLNSQKEHLEHVQSGWETALSIGLAVAAIVAACLFVFDLGVRKVSKRIQDVQDEIIRTKDAELQLALGEKDIEIGALKVSSDNAEAGIAAANQKAAEATEAAEAEKIERLKLEAQIAPRRLSPKQQQDVANACSPYHGLTVDVVSYALDAEGDVLAHQIIDALRRGGVNFIDSSATLQALGGFDRGIRVDGTDQQFADAMRNALSFEGGLFVLPKDAPATNRVALRSGGGGKADISVLVGVKPIQP